MCNTKGCIIIIVMLFLAAPEPDVDEDDGNGGVPENVNETGTSQMEPADRKAIVNQHNKLRRTTKPTPANMKKMVY